MWCFGNHFLSLDHDIVLFFDCSILNLFSMIGYCFEFIMNVRTCTNTDAKTKIKGIDGIYPAGIVKTVLLMIL